MEKSWINVGQSYVTYFNSDEQKLYVGQYNRVRLMLSSSYLSILSLLLMTISSRDYRQQSQVDIDSMSI